MRKPFIPAIAILLSGIISFSQFPASAHATESSDIQISTVETKKTDNAPKTEAAKKTNKEKPPVAVTPKTTPKTQPAPASAPPAPVAEKKPEAAPKAAENPTPAAKPADEKTESAPAASPEKPAEQPEAPEAPSETSVGNDFLKIIVNTMSVDTGRFLVRTAKGDPFRPTDDDKILIYGGAVPWTSFTTIRVDGVNYVFGGPTKRRAGKEAQYGVVTEKPTVSDNAVTTKCNIDGLDVTQTLSIAGGPVSHLYDTLKIQTTIRNTSSSAKKIGVRLLLDTLLGNNDASPFKVGEKNITAETDLNGGDVPEYWIAYDSLEDPGVVARGTLRGPGLSTPDRIIFANWGKLADNIWDVPLSTGQTFQREREEEMDSATALYWNETSVAPGDQISLSTLYGIEYLNVAGDILSIGAQRNLGEWPTAKNQVRPYTLYAYVADSSDIDLHDVTVSLVLPEGIEFAGGDSATKHLGNLSPKVEKTVGWNVMPRVGGKGNKTIKIVGKAKEVEEVVLETKAVLLPPPEILTSITAPEKLDRSKSREYGPYGPPFPIQIKCSNDGKYFVDNLRVKLILPEGLKFPRIQKAVQNFPRLDGGKDVVFSWKVIATGEKSGSLEYRIVVESDSTDAKTVSNKINVEPLPISLSWKGVPEKADINVFISAELYVTDVTELGSAEMSIKYDPAVIEIVRVSQGTLFTENDQPLPWKDPVIDRKQGMVTGIKGIRATPLDNDEGSLVAIHFKTKGAGTSKLELIEPKIENLKGDGLEFQFTPASITVTEE